LASFFLRDRQRLHRRHVDPERVEIRDGVSGTAFPRSGLLDGVDIGLALWPIPRSASVELPNKVIDYVMWGIPYVASASEPYQALRTGRLVGSSLADQSPAAWQAELERLLDPEERVAVAKANTAAIDWDIKDHVGEWESVLSELVGLRRETTAPKGGRNAGRPCSPLRPQRPIATRSMPEQTFG
jgi:hypothetical protein